MKHKITTILAAVFLLFLMAVFPAQSQANDNRHVLIEVFTSTTCPPCLPAAVGLDSWLSTYPDADRVSVIKYPVSWPGSGCIFHWQNPLPVNLRRGYYGGINSAPTGLVDGTPFGGNWTSWRNAVLNRMSVASPVDIEMVAMRDNNQLQVVVDLTRLSGADWPAMGLSLRLAVVERNIAYNGPNGSTNQDFVHREMINGAAGVPVSITDGQTITLSYTLEIASGWNQNNLQVVAFVQPTQNSPSRVVVQSAMVPVTQGAFVGVPETQTPQNGAQLVPFSDLAMEWTSALNATEYDLQISETPGFQSNTVAFQGHNGTSITVAELAPSTTYYWRVRGTNTGAGLTGVWSAVSTFTTVMAAPATEPVLLQPSNGSEVTTQIITLQWAAVQSASSYDVEVSKNSDLSDPIITRNNITQLNTTLIGLEQATTYYWRVRGVNVGGPGSWSEAFTFSTPTPTSTEPETDLPRLISLNQNYPNPFNPLTNISFELPEAAEISLSVYSLEGRRVAVLANGQFGAGTHTISFDAASLSSGTYIYRLDTAGQSLTRLMTLLK